MAKKHYEKVEETLDLETGELLTLKKLYHRQVTAKKFIKVYLDDIGAIIGLTTPAEYKVLMCLWELTEWGTNEVVIYKEVRSKIAKSVDRSESCIANTITSLVNKKILLKPSRMKYILNPQLFFKGEEVDRENVLRFCLEYRII